MVLKHFMNSFLSWLPKEIPSLLEVSEGSQQPGDAPPGVEESLVVPSNFCPIITPLTCADVSSVKISEL